MRLRLNTILRAALIAAAFAATGAYAFTVTDIPAGTVTVSTDSDYNKDGVVYTASTGVLTGVDSAALTFVLNNNALSQNSGSTSIIYVSTSSAAWGFNASDDKMTGHWQGENWVKGGYVEQSALTPHADQSGNVQLTASIRNVKPGTRLYYGDSVTDNNKLYEAEGLVSTNTGNIQKVTLNKTFVTSFDYQKIGGATVTAGTWTKTYDKVSRNAISETSVNATLAISGRTQVSGGTQSTNLSNNGGDIIVGNAGQLFLQTWGSSAISLANDIYIGSSTQGDVGTYGVIRFGNDSHETTLNNLHLIENSSIGSNATGGQAVNINGTVDGAFELTIKQGQKYHFADMNISKLTLNNATVVDFAGDVTLGALSMAAGTNMTIKETGSLTVGAGTIKFGANGISITQDADVTLNEGTVFDLSQLTPQNGVYTLFTGAGADLSTYNYTAENNIIGVTTVGSEWKFGTNGTISFTKIASKVWTGVEDSGVGNWNYEDSNWNSEQFKAGDIAEFNDYAKVTVNAAVQAGGITTTGNALVTIENDETTPGSLSSPSVELADETYLTSNISIANVASYSVGTGAVWLIGGDQTLAAGSGTNNGTIMVSGSLTFTGTATAADVANVSNYGGTVSVNFGSATARVDMEDSIGTLDVQGGTIDYRSKLGEQTLKLDNGTKLLFGDKDGAAVDAPVFTNDIVLGGNATIQVHGNSKHSSVTISGDVTGTGYTLTKADGNQNLIFSGKVDIAGLTTASDGNGTIIFNGGEGSLGNITTNGTSTIKFSAKDGAKNEYTFETFAMSPNSSDATRWLVVDSGVTVHGTGNSVGDSSTIHSGWGVKNGGLEVNGVLTTDSTIGLEAASQAAYIKGSGIINTAGLNLCNGSTTYIQDGITINITSDKGIYARNPNAAASSIHLKNATLQATTADWEFKVGRAADPVTLEDTTDGTTFEAAADRTITISKVLSGEGKFVKDGEGTVVLKGDNTYTGDTVVKGGTLDIQGSISAGSKVKVAENATLAGKTGDISMSIAAEKTATIKGADGFSPKDSGITFSSENDIVTIENTGNAEITYSIDNANAKVTADELAAYSDDAPIVVNNEVNVSSISNWGDAALTLTQIGTETQLESIDNYGGQVTLQNVGSNPIEIASITLFGTTVAAYTGNNTTPEDEATITITEAMNAGSGTLLANLTLVGNSLLDVDGGDDAALTLGSLLTVDNANGLVNLDQETLEAISGLKEGEHVTLVKGLEGTSFNTNLQNGDGARTHFDLSSINEGDYQVYVGDNSMGIMKTSAVPEPTTGTLSLLALMALAARRRRK